MNRNLMKSLAQWGIAHGMPLPHAPWERVSELWFLRDLLLELEVDCVLDVGANRGQFALELRGIGYAGRIVSFEPIASEFEALRTAFSKDTRWHGLNLALGSTDEVKTLTIPRLSVLSSLLDSRVEEPNARVEQVVVRRLDGLFAEALAGAACRRVFLKMDTQGFDLEVFRGAAGCLDRICGLQSELSIQPLYRRMPHYLEALSAYEAAGFELHNLSVVGRAPDHGLIELNGLMRRRATALSAGAAAGSPT